METIVCPHCGSPTTRCKWGHNRAGTQRARCLTGRRNFTPFPKEQGHGAAIHEQAVPRYLEGTGQRAIGRLLGVVHPSDANWVVPHAACVPNNPTEHSPPDEKDAGTVAVDA